MNRRDIRIHAEIAVIAAVYLAAGTTLVLGIDALVRWAL